MNKITIINHNGREVINPQIRHWEILSLHETLEIVCAPLDKMYEGQLILAEWPWI